MSGPHRTPAGPAATWGELFRGRLGIYTILLNLGIGVFAIDIFVIATVMPTVVADIGGVAYYAWAFMLFIVGTITGAASFAPLTVAVGARFAYAAGGIVYLAGAAVCGAAPDILVFLVGRTVQGVGAGIASAGSYALIGTLFEGRLRPRIFALTNATWVVATIAGPFLGGAFAQIGWWRGAFWTLVPVAVTFVAAALWKLPRDRATPGGGRPGFPYDRLALLALGVVCVAAAARIAADELRWALVVAGPALIWYAFRRDRDAENRLFPRRALSMRAPVGAAYWIQFLIGGAQNTVYIYMPLVLQAVYGVAPLFVGAANLALSLAWSVGAAVVAPLHGGRERLPMAVGPIVIFTAVAGLAYDIASVSLVFVLGCAAWLGFGIGLYTPHTLSKTMELAAKGEETVTSSSLQTVRSLGVAFGAASSALIVNMAGLESVSGADAVATAVTWVYLFDLAPLLAALVLMLIFLAQTGRTALVPPTGDTP
jgi:MFS family permease